MNNIKVFSAAVAAILISVSTSVIAGDNDDISIHGSACAAANLGQAQNFGAKWSQAGVRNPNPIGSGRQFFVICPIVTNAEPGDTNPLSDVYIHVAYQDLSADLVTCVVRRARISGEFIKTVVATPSVPFPVDPAVNSYANYQIAEDFIDSSDGWNYLGFDETISVVCALPPQSGIFGVALRQDP